MAFVWTLEPHSSTWLLETTAYCIHRVSKASVYLVPGEARTTVYLVQMSDHVALALDGTLAQRDKQAGLGLQTLHHCIADMHTAGEAVALHTAGHIHSVPQEAIARALHADHTGIGRPTVHACAIAEPCYWTIAGKQQLCGTRLPSSKGQDLPCMSLNLL